MTQTETEMRRLFTELELGDRVEVEHTITVGMKRWTTTTCGTMVKTDRRRHGLHHQRNRDDKVWSDIMIIQRDDGELTTVTVDEFTEIRKC